MSTTPPQVREEPDCLPTDAELAKAGEIPVYDADGVARPFSSLYATGGRRNLVIFVRHFFCGICQDFLRALIASVSPSELSSLPRPTTLTIIGCGSPDLIRDYAAHTRCDDLTIYADPSRELYHTLGMTSTMNLGPTRPEYQTSKMMLMAAKSILQGLTAGTGAVKGGSFSQVGGEFLFAEDGEVEWCHRMRNTRDHTEIPDLKKLLGME